MTEFPFQETGYAKYWFLVSFQNLHGKTILMTRIFFKRVGDAATGLGWTGSFFWPACVNLCLSHFVLQFGLLTGLGALGLMIWLMATPHSRETEEKRLAILAGFAFLTGMCGAGEARTEGSSSSLILHTCKCGISISKKKTFLAAFSCWGSGSCAV